MLSQYSHHKNGRSSSLALKTITDSKLCDHNNHIIKMEGPPKFSTQDNNKHDNLCYHNNHIIKKALLISPQDVHFSASRNV